MSHRARLAASLVAVAACRAPTDAPPAPRADGYEDCTAGGLLGLFVFTRDAATGATVTAGATLTWRAGLSTGTEYPGPGRTLPDGTRIEPNGIAGPYGRPGIFELVVQVPGYQEWRTSGVQVAQGATRCSVREIVRVDALLTHRP